MAPRTRAQTRAQKMELREDIDMTEDNEMPPVEESDMTEDAENNPLEESETSEDDEMTSIEESNTWEDNGIMPGVPEDLTDDDVLALEELRYFKEKFLAYKGLPKELHDRGVVIINRALEKRTVMQSEIDEAIEYGRPLREVLDRVKDKIGYLCYLKNCAEGLVDDDDESGEQDLVDIKPEQGPAISVGQSKTPEVELPFRQKEEE